MLLLTRCLWLPQVLLPLLMIGVALIQSAANARKMSIRELRGQLLGSTVLSAGKTHRLLRHFRDNPIAARLADLYDKFDANLHCKLQPLTETRVLVKAYQPMSTVEIESDSMRIYMDHCEQLRQTRCREAGLKPLDMAEVLKRAKSLEQDLAELAKQQDVHQQVLELLAPFALDSRLVSLVAFGNNSDDLACRADRSRQIMAIPLRPEADELSFETLKNYIDSCRRQQHQHCEEFSKQQAIKFTEALKLAKLAAFGSTKALMRMVRKSNEDAQDICKRRYWMGKVWQLRSSYESSSGKWYSLLGWSHLMGACRVYMGALGQNAVQKFISMHALDKLSDQEYEWLAALIMCHDIIGKNDAIDGPPVEFQVRTAVSRILM